MSCFTTASEKWGTVIFSVCLSVHRRAGWGGGHIPGRSRFRRGGTPGLGPDGGGAVPQPCPGQDGVVPQPGPGPNVGVPRDGVPPIRTRKGVLATQQAVCLLRSRRRTFLLSNFLLQSINPVIFSK